MTIDGRSYRLTGPQPSVDRLRLGDEVATVKCSFVSHAYVVDPSKPPPPAPDAVLPYRAKVRAVDGYPASYRLAARKADGTLAVYDVWSPKLPATGADFLPPLSKVVRMEAAERTLGPPWREQPGRRNTVSPELSASVLAALHPAPVKPQAPDWSSDDHVLTLALDDGTLTTLYWRPGASLLNGVAVVRRDVARRLTALLPEPVVPRPRSSSHEDVHR